MLPSGGTCFADLIPSWLTFMAIEYYLHIQAIFFGFHGLPVLFSLVHFLLATVSVLLGCSCISISVHLTSPSIACFLASFASFGLPWPYLGLSTWFTVCNRHSCQSRILLWLFTNLSSLADLRNSILFDILVQWSSPINSTSDSGRGQEVYPHYYCWQTAVQNVLVDDFLPYVL